MKPRARVALAGLAAPGAAALVVAGRTFPDVTFRSSAPESGAPMGPGFDASADDGSFVGDDAQAVDAPAGQDAGTPETGAPPVGVDGGCDFNGTWATRITIDVTWQPQGLMSVILAPGLGTITQWVKGARVQKPATPMALSDDSVVCGIELPPFQATALGLNEVYGVRFTDMLFDDGYLPRFTVNAALTPQSGEGFAYSTTPTAVLLGLTMASPTTDPWPTTVTTEDDMDMDGNPGVTVPVATGAVQTPTPTATSYSYIPTNIPAPLQPIDLAQSLYLAIRQVTVASGAVKDCDTITGTVSIPTIASKPAIDSHILGCALVDGGACTTGASSEASFVDNSQPVFTPTGTTTFESIRLPPGAACADVRGAFH